MHRFDFFFVSTTDSSDGAVGSGFKEGTPIAPTSPEVDGLASAVIEASLLCFGGGRNDREESASTAALEAAR